MIRINLSPSAKRKVQQTRAITAVHMVVPTTKVSRGSVYAVAMLLGWVGVGVIALLLQRGVQEDTVRIKAQAAALAADAKKINEKINDEDLQARANRFTELTGAIATLETKRRSPVYVYHELGNILTTGKGPDIDEAEERKRAFLDPQARLDLDWDANAVWLKSMIEEDNNVLEITGGVRDPDDLSEFVKRLRASTRFARISHPKFAFETVKQSTSSAPKVLKPGESSRDHYSFQLTAQVKDWD